MSAARSPSRSASLHLYPPAAEIHAASALIKQAKIPHIPEVVLALRQELTRPEPSVQAASELILRDPAMTGDVLKLVNSPAFKRRVPVASVVQAATLLGLPRLTQYVTAVAMQRVIAGMDARVRELWKDIQASMEAMTAVALRLRGLSAEEVYLFGTLHDIGALLFATRSQDYISEWVLHSDSAPSRLLEYERRAFGLDHQVVAFMIAAHWKLPESLALAMAHHHAPGSLEAPEPRIDQLIAVAKAAEYMVARARGTHELPEMQGYHEDARHELELTNDDWQALYAQADAGTWSD